LNISLAISSFNDLAIKELVDFLFEFYAFSYYIFDVMALDIWSFSSYATYDEDSCYLLCYYPCF